VLNRAEENGWVILLPNAVQIYIITPFHNSANFLNIFMNISEILYGIVKEDDPLSATSPQRPRGPTSYVMGSAPLQPQPAAPKLSPALAQQPPPGASLAGMGHSVPDQPIQSPQPTPASQQMPGVVPPTNPTMPTRAEQIMTGRRPQPVPGGGTPGVVPPTNPTMPSHAEQIMTSRPQPDASSPYVEGRGAIRRR
jgi:hypothetical protein